MNRHLRWTAGDPPEPGFLDLSEEAEREFVATQLEADIDEGRLRTEKRWRMQREARRLLRLVRILRTVRTGPNVGEVKEHSFSVVDCCRYPVKREEDHFWENYLVDVLRSKDSGHTFFANVKRCGSVWTCPICAARITEKRRQELQEALRNWTGIGGTVCLLTLTIPHHAGQETASWRNQLLRAYCKMRNRTFWRELAQGIGLEGSVRALEVTYGNNGAHVHIHVLLFCMPTT